MVQRCNAQSEVRRVDGEGSDARVGLRGIDPLLRPAGPAGLRSKCTFSAARLTSISNPLFLGDALGEATVRSMTRLVISVKVVGETAGTRLHHIILISTTTTFSPRKS